VPDLLRSLSFSRLTDDGVDVLGSLRHVEEVAGAEGVRQSILVRAEVEVDLYAKMASA
jgi:hypothetical protein